MPLKPLDDRIIVKPLEAETTTPGGIVLPDQAKERPAKGRVLRVGPGARLAGTRERLEIDLKEGASVIYPKYAGAEVEVAPREFVLVLREGDILAVDEE